MLVKADQVTLADMRLGILDTLFDLQTYLCPVSRELSLDRFEVCIFAAQTCMSTLAPWGREWNVDGAVSRVSR